jgi:pimeloyl-ACP methyl ester carboxylesterase
MRFFESDVTANGIKLHVYRTNANKPPLLFAHGMSDNGLCFWPVAEQFAGGFEIILYDSRNHGKSEAPKTGTTLIDRAQDLAALVNTLGLEKPCLIGHSLGAVTIALLAGLHPHMPGCIVLEDPPPFERLAAQDGPSVAHHEAWRESAAINKEKSVEELMEMNRQESPTWPESERQPWARSKLQYSLQSFGEDRIDVLLGNRIVSQIMCPVLLITADLDQGALYPPDAADELVSELPNARHINIPGAGHNIRREQPAAYSAAVRDFLNSQNIKD